MISAILVSTGIAAIFGLLLGIALRFFKEREDPRVEQIYRILPHLDCGSCGFAGCRQYAAAVAKGTDPGRCRPGGEKVAAKISRIIGKEVTAEKMIARVLCHGGKNASDASEYEGPDSCRDASALGTYKECSAGCLGFGDCAGSCRYGAIVMSEDGFPVIDPERCVGCGECANACPKGLIAMVPAKSKVHIGCSSHDKGSVKSGYCATGCISCGICAKVCPKGAIEIVDNLPRIDYSKCISCGLCVRKCPRKIIKML